jgi:phospholipid/cholesterol/gamma-HCH transport system substrate-binding protein
MNKQIYPFEIKNSDRLLGLLLVIFIISVFSFSLWWIYERDQETNQIPYYTFLDQSFGILKASEINLSGIVIGRVEKISLQNNSKVKVNIVIEKKYASFITTGCVLKMNSSFGLSSLVGGTGLRLTPNPDSRQPLAAGSFIQTIQPKDLNQVLSEEEIARISADIKTIIQNLATISSSISNKQTIFESTANEVSAIIHQTAKMMTLLPQILIRVESGFSAWESSGLELHQLIVSSGKTIDATSNNFNDGSKKFNRILAHIEQTTKETNEILSFINSESKTLKKIIHDSQDLITNANQLTNKVNNHWLLGESRKDSNVNPLMFPHPEDKSLYLEEINKSLVPE